MGETKRNHKGKILQNISIQEREETKMRIKAIEITDIYERENDWFIKVNFREVLNYTRNLLDQISNHNEIGEYNITSFDYIKIMDNLTKKFSYNKGV